jgi:RNA polymerase sigma factor (sigma-70 family)
MRRVRGRSDGELIAATPGDPEAFAEFYRRYERSVIGFFMHWCRSAEVAADLMAETFAAAFESAARYQPELGEPSAWLFGIARNMLARSVRRGRVEDETRRRLGMTALVVDDDAIDRIDALATGGRSPECNRAAPAAQRPRRTTLQHPRSTQRSPHSCRCSHERRPVLMRCRPNIEPSPSASTGPRSQTSLMPAGSRPQTARPHTWSPLTQAPA